MRWNVFRIWLENIISPLTSHNNLLVPYLNMFEPLMATQVVQYRQIEPKDAISVSKSSVQLAPTRPLQPLQPTARNESPSPSPTSILESTVKKRKRDTSPLPNNADKRARHSAASGSSADMKRTLASDRPSPAPRSFPAPSTSTSKSVNRWSSIARSCVSSSRVDTTDFVTSYDIVKGNLNNFKLC